MRKAIVDQSHASFEYFLVVLKCATHQSNLAATSALFGKTNANIQASDLVSTCSRAHKYVIPDYYEEIRHNLWLHLKDKFNIISPDSEEATEATSKAADWRMIERLYGVFGSDLLDIFNADITNFQHIAKPQDCTHSEDFINGLRSKGMGALVSKLLHVSEVPVVTRFWLFEAAVQNLLLWHLLQLPFRQIVQPHQTQPRPANAKRLKRVQEYMSKPGVGKELRLSTLGMRVCMVATNVTGQKRNRATATVKDDKPKPDPMLVRLARGLQDRQTAM